MLSFLRRQQHADDANEISPLRAPAPQYAGDTTAVNGLLASVAGELRGPLTGIASFAEMLLDESAGPLNEVQREFATEIDRCSLQLLGLLGNVLDYARASEIQLSLETVALSELVDQCVMMTHSHAQRNEVEVTCHIDADVSEIVADPIRLRQIVVSLLDNAIARTPSRGLVRVQARRDGYDVVISVRDTGQGNRQVDQRVFDPLCLAPDSDQEIAAGLALALARTLVELHGGSITVDSAPQSGTLFTVRLPCGTSQATSGGLSPTEGRHAHV